MRVQVDKLSETQAAMPVERAVPAAEESFKDIMKEYSAPETEADVPAVQGVSPSLPVMTAREDTVDSIRDRTQDNLSWQVYYQSGGHFQLGETFRMPAMLPSYDEAVRAIGPGGPYSVEAVSNCILSMAAYVAKGDPDKIVEIRQEIEKAVAIFRRDYQAATKAKDLPQICLDTYDAIMSGLDKLQAEYTANNAATEISA
ncbi:hypothetical protein SAMN02910356_00565 [Selenomonas sp. GACV-9]|uniref:hypothetical protein n=1 Tax=Selenomonas sp. GACV-9 TaxID=3158782 RepID=UPI0008E9D1C7|nr:hypothetical protein SAMN02910356_00565 [Selenomonas ruminantium]